MQVDPQEILFIRKHAPKGFIRTVANNIGLGYYQVRTELYSLKEDYNAELVTECRRLLKAMTGKVFKRNQTQVA